MFGRAEIYYCKPGSNCNHLDPGLAGKMLFMSENWEWWQDHLDFHVATEVVVAIEEMED